VLKKTKYSIEGLLSEATVVVDDFFSASTEIEGLEDVYSENTEVDSTIVQKYFLLNKENVEDNNDENNNVEGLAAVFTPCT